MIERINLTTKCDAEWRSELARSFRDAAASASNQLIKEWYENEVARLMVNE